MVIFFFIKNAKHFQSPTSRLLLLLHVIISRSRKTSQLQSRQDFPSSCRRLFCCFFLPSRSPLVASLIRIKVFRDRCLESGSGIVVSCTRLLVRTGTFFSSEVTLSGDSPSSSSSSGEESDIMERMMNACGDKQPDGVRTLLGMTSLTHKADPPRELQHSPDARPWLLRQIRPR